jgi:hypothetical protein
MRAETVGSCVVPPSAVLVPCSSLVDWFRLGPAAWHPPTERPAAAAPIGAPTV